MGLHPLPRRTPHVRDAVSGHVFPQVPPRFEGTTIVTIRADSNTSAERNTPSALGGRSRIRTWVGLGRRIYSPSLSAFVPTSCVGSVVKLQVKELAVLASRSIGKLCCGRPADGIDRITVSGEEVVVLRAYLVSGSKTAPARQQCPELFRGSTEQCACWSS